MLQNLNIYNEQDQRQEFSGIKQPIDDIARFREANTLASAQTTA